MSKAKPKPKPEQPSSFEILSRLAVPFGFHMKLDTVADILTISGHTDYADSVNIAGFAGCSGAVLTFTDWQKTPRTHNQVILVFRQFLIVVLRDFANALESGDIGFISSSQEGILTLGPPRPETEAEENHK